MWFTYKNVYNSNFVFGLNSLQRKFHYLLIFIDFKSFSLIWFLMFLLCKFVLKVFNIIKKSIDYLNLYTESWPLLPLSHHMSYSTILLNFVKIERYTLLGKHILKIILGIFFKMLWANSNFGMCVTTLKIIFFIRSNKQIHFGLYKNKGKSWTLERKSKVFIRLLCLKYKYDRLWPLITYEFNRNYKCGSW